MTLLLHKKSVIHFFYTFFLVLFLGGAEYFLTKNGVVSIEFSKYVESYILVFILFYLSLLSGYKTFSLIVTNFIIYIIGSNIVFLTYFGRLLMPYDISQFFYEFADIMGGLSGGIKIFLIPLCLYLLLIVLNTIYILKYVNNKEAGYKKYLFFMVAVLGLMGLMVPALKGKVFENNLHYPVVRNTINCISSFLIGSSKSLFSEPEAKKVYSKYSVENIDTVQDFNVIVVVGESTAFKHLGLYGYERQTTPFLSSLNGQSGFKYFYGISRGFSTRIGVPLLLNVIYEPDNAEQLLSMQTNLFTLAKETGRNTLYLSNQKSGVLASLVNMKDINQFHDVFSKEMPENTTDMRLIELMEKKKEALAKTPYFMVLHQRNSHFAYEENYPQAYNFYTGNKDEFSKLVDTYDNSMHFQDDFFKALRASAQRVSSKPTLIFYTSDHGELFGENSLWGHGTPILQSAAVPILMFGVNGAEKWVDDLQYSNCYMTNYELGKIVAASFGRKIINPNENNDQIFININLPLDSSSKFTEVNAKEAKGLCSQ